MRVNEIEKNVDDTVSIFLNNEVNLLLAEEAPVVLYGIFKQNGTDDVDGSDTISSAGTAVTGTDTQFQSYCKQQKGDAEVGQLGQQGSIFSAHGSKRKTGGEETYQWR